jgi:hypothetical protein
MVVEWSAVEGAPPRLPHHDLVVAQLLQLCSEQCVAVECEFVVGQELRCDLRARRTGPHHPGAFAQRRPADEVDVVTVVQPDGVHDRPGRQPVGRHEFGHSGKPVGCAGDLPRPPVEEVDLYVDDQQR